LTATVSDLADTLTKLGEEELIGFLEMLPSPLNSADVRFRGSYIDSDDTFIIIPTDVRSSIFPYLNTVVNQITKDYIMEVLSDFNMLEEEVEEIVDGLLDEYLADVKTIIQSIISPNLLGWIGPAQVKAILGVAIQDIEGILADDELIDLIESFDEYAVSELEDLRDEMQELYDNFDDIIAEALVEIGGDMIVPYTLDGNTLTLTVEVSRSGESEYDPETDSWIEHEEIETMTLTFTRK